MMSSQALHHQTSQSGIPTMAEMIVERAARNPEAAALLAPGRQPLTYAGLRRQMESVAEELNRAGVGVSDRVAVVLKNGPDLAAAFLTIGASAACAPLNPDYRDGEFDFYLTDLKARALVVESGIDSPVRAVARKHGIPVL